MSSNPWWTLPKQLTWISWFQLKVINSMGMSWEARRIVQHRVLCVSLLINLIFCLVGEGDTGWIWSMFWRVIWKREIFNLVNMRMFWIWDVWLRTASEEWTTNAWCRMIYSFEQHIIVWRFLRDIYIDW